MYNIGLPAEGARSRQMTLQLGAVAGAAAFQASRNVLSAFPLKAS